MHAFEFGYAVGALEKQALAPTLVAGAAPQNFRMVGNALATIPGQVAKGAPFRTFARQGLEAAKRIGGTVAGDIGGAMPRLTDMYTLAGIAGLGGTLSGSPEQGGRNIGRVAGMGAGGGVGAGIGKSVSRLLPQKYQAAAQLAGGLGGAALGYMGAGKMMGPPKQAGAIADTAKSVMDKSKQVAGKAEGVAKGVANKAVDMGAKARQGFDKWRKTPNPIVKATSAGGASKAAQFGAQLGIGQQMPTMPSGGNGIAAPQRSGPHPFGDPAALGKKLLGQAAQAGNAFDFLKARAANPGIVAPPQTGPQPGAAY